MRTIRYSELYEQCKAELAPVVPRLEEIEAGVEWAVSANAEDYGEAVPGAHSRVALTDPFPGAPAMVWYFRCEDADYAVIEWVGIDWEWVAGEEAEDAEDT